MVNTTPLVLYVNFPKTADDEKAEQALQTYLRQTGHQASALKTVSCVLPATPLPMLDVTTQYQGLESINAYIKYKRAEYDLHKAVLVTEGKLVELKLAPRVNAPGWLPRT